MQFMAKSLLSRLVLTTDKEMNDSEKEIKPKALGDDVNAEDIYWNMKSGNEMDPENEDVTGITFGGPECLIYTDHQNKLAIKQDVLDKIAKVSKQLNVVTIAGLYRTGKSYLLTRLANKYKGFPLGSTIESTTKGIWAWCLDHPKYSNQTLLLLDTEGLGDVMKGDRNNDNQLFALVTLLSSTLIYNMMGALDQNALDKLHFITEMSNHIRTFQRKDATHADQEFDRYCPEFILALRDFTLQLKIVDKDVTSDEYLEHCLALEPESDIKKNSYNHQRSCIRKYFKKRKCFVFEQPATRQSLIKLETLTDNDLDKAFVENVNRFKRHVHRNCKPFLLDGTPVTGRRWCSLVTSYVTSIREGAVPCIEIAIQSMSRQENKKSVNDALKSYVNGMGRELGSETQTHETVLTAHVRCQSTSLEVFLKGSVLDTRNVYKAELDKRIEQQCTRFHQRNEDLSTEKCTKALRQLRCDIDSKIKDEYYSKPGGSKEYKSDRDTLRIDYYMSSNLGVNKEKTYVKFLNEWETEEKRIYTADKALTEQQKNAEDERRKNDKLRQEQAILKMENENMKKKMENNYILLKNEMERVNRKHEEEIKEQRQQFNVVNKERQALIDQVMEEQAAAIKNINKKYEKDNVKRDKKLQEARANYEKIMENYMNEKYSSEENFKAMLKELKSKRNCSIS